MAMSLTQHQLDRSDLVLVVGCEGLVEWSANRGRDEVVAMLRSVADGIEEGSL